MGRLSYSLAYNVNKIVLTKDGWHNSSIPPLNLDKIHLVVKIIVTIVSRSLSLSLPVEYYCLLLLLCLTSSVIAFST
jgi:hypothetical protein